MIVPMSVVLSVLITRNGRLGPICLHCRLLVEKHIANIAIPPEVFAALLFNELLCFERRQVTRNRCQVKGDIFFFAKVFFHFLFLLVLLTANVDRLSVSPVRDLYKAYVFLFFFLLHQSPNLLQPHHQASWDFHSS